jgi:DegV family protein with EDD domain
MEMSIPEVALLSDSTCDIPDHLIEQYQISIIPQTVIWNEDVLLDRVELSPLEFYQRLEKDPIHPKSALPTPESILSAYQKASERGARRAMMFTVSSQMSGTYQLAKKMTENSPLPVDVVDGKGPTMSLGWQVLAAARCQEDGGDHQDMIQAAAEARSTMVQFVLMNTLEYLHKGGRIGRAALMLGSLLDFKPLVEIDHQTGIVEAAGRIRTRRKGLEELWNQFFMKMDPTKTLHIAVLHGNAKKEAQELADRISETFHPAELLINITGPVLGINTGPGALALCGYSE